MRGTFDTVYSYYANRYDSIRYVDFRKNDSKTKKTSLPKPEIRKK